MVKLSWVSLHLINSLITFWINHLIPDLWYGYMMLLLYLLLYSSRWLDTTGSFTALQRSYIYRVPTYMHPSIHSIHSDIWVVPTFHINNCIITHCGARIIVKQASEKRGDEGIGWLHTKKMEENKSILLPCGETLKPGSWQVEFMKLLQYRPC